MVLRFRLSPLQWGMHAPGPSHHRRIELARSFLAIAVLPVLIACVDGAHPDERPHPVEDPPDPVEGCVEGDGAVVEVEATLTDVPTVVRVTWRTPAHSSGVVHFTTATGVRRTSVSSGTEHEVLLLGNRAHTDVPFRIASDDGVTLSCGEVRTVTTGALPADLPNLGVTIADGYAVEGGGYTVVSIIRQLTSFVVLLDSGGEYVWAWEDTEGTYAGQYFNADVDLARSGLLVNELADAADADGAVLRIGFDGAVRAPVYIEGSHTDFVELPDGGIAALSWDIREVDGERYLGDRIVEVDAAGNTRTVWNVWDHYTPDPHTPWPTGYYVADGTVLDWSHVNAIAYDAANDAFLVSLPFNQSIARIDRETGSMTWVIRGDGLVQMPHSVQALGDSVLVFNRGHVGMPEACSEAREIDLASRTSVWSYQTEPCLLVPFLGAALRLPDGNTLVDWSSAGQLDEVSPSNELLWRVNLDLGAAFGFADRLDSLYPTE